MDKLFPEAVQEYVVSLTLYIGKLVAGFLIATNRIKKAIEFYKECLVLLSSSYRVSEKLTNGFPDIERSFSIDLLKAYRLIGDHKNAIEFGRNRLDVLRSSSKINPKEDVFLFSMAELYEQEGNNREVKGLFEETLAIMKLTDNRKGQVTCYLKLGIVCQSLGDYNTAKECFEKGSVIVREFDDKSAEAWFNEKLGTLYYWSLNETENAKKSLEKALVLRKVAGDRNKEAENCANLAHVFQSLCDYDKAKEYFEKALAFFEEICDKKNEALCNENLANVWVQLERYNFAIKYYQTALEIHKEIGDRENEAICYGNMGVVWEALGEYPKSKEYHKKALSINQEIGHRKGEVADYIHLGTLFRSIGDCCKAKEYFLRALPITMEIVNKEMEASCYGHIGTVFNSLGEFTKAREYLQKGLVIREEIGNKKGIAEDYGNLGDVFHALGDFATAKQYYEKAIVINREIGYRRDREIKYNSRLGNLMTSLGEKTKAIQYYEKALETSKKVGDRRSEASCHEILGQIQFHIAGGSYKGKQHCEDAIAINQLIDKEIGSGKGEASCYESLGVASLLLGAYTKAKEYHEEALAIRKNYGDKGGEALSHEHLGDVFLAQGEIASAKEHYENAIAINKEIGRRQREAECYGRLGDVFHFIGDKIKTRECHKEALEIRREIGDKVGEAECNENLGLVFHSLGEHATAKDYFEKAITIYDQVGAREQEAMCYINLASVLVSFGQKAKAKKCLEKALVIGNGIGDKRVEALCYGNLGYIFDSLGDYIASKDYHEKALAIYKEIGCRTGEGALCGSLGHVSHSLGDNAKAKDYHEKALVIAKEMGDKRLEPLCYQGLANFFHSLGEFAMAEDYLEEALVMYKEDGCKSGEGLSYKGLGSFFHSLGEYTKTKEYYGKALEIMKEIGDRDGEASCYDCLGNLFLCLEDYSMAKESYGKAVTLYRDIGSIEGELDANGKLSWVLLFEGRIHDAQSHLFTDVLNCEKMQSFLKKNERFKILFLDQYSYLYQFLSHLLCITGDRYKGLDVVELGRARALADLMSAQYSVEEQVVFSHLLEASGAAAITRKERSFVCLYISRFEQMLLFWIVKEGRIIGFRKVDINECLNNKATVRDVEEMFADQVYRKFYVVAPELCENQSYWPSNANHPERISYHTTSRLIEVDNDENQQVQSDPTLADSYKMIIAPVFDFLDGETEVMIVPDPFLFKVPFEALQDKDGSYLSETFRIRIVPSLTTLNLIHNSPAEYHSQTGALMVGDPDVGWVLYKGSKVYRSSLPFAREEARMLGRILGAETLLGKEATKQAVLHSIHSVSLVHFAAHGNPKTGEIYLARPISIDGTPQEEDYLLTMADISKVQLRAKLVVLSCCHTADGEIRAEGVVGMARAFLGSGARSVLAARWAVDDEATMHFMFRFYYHLVRGESASESLHKTMKWMRAGPYSKVQQWAPFMLIGDNVTFNFNKKRYAYEKTIDQFLNY